METLSRFQSAGAARLPRTDVVKASVAVQLLGRSRGVKVQVSYKQTLQQKSGRACALLQTEVRGQTLLKRLSRRD
jgi:hypothetical protein